MDRSSTRRRCRVLSVRPRCQAQCRFGTSRVTSRVAFQTGCLDRAEVERVTAEWTVEMYADPRGHCPIQGWFDGLSAAKFAAIDAAVRHQLQKQGIALAGTAWLKPLKDGLYEFRVRSTAAEIVRMYADAGHFLRTTPRRSCSGSSWPSTATGLSSCSTAMTRPRTRARSGSSERSPRHGSC